MTTRLHLLSSRGTVLLLVLWMLILLGIVGLSYNNSVRTQVHALRASRGHVEALWAARAGIERARLALADAEPADLVAGSRLLSDAEAYANQPVGPAVYSLIVPNPDPQAPPGYGLVDEAARVNLNSVDEQMLGRLPGITQEMIGSLIDWRDQDSLPRPLGAESEFYDKLENPYPMRNGELLSLRELLRVRDWGPVFRQVWPDPYERLAGDKNQMPPSPIGTEAARRLLAMLTVWSADGGKAPDGQDRMDLGSADASQMRERIGGLQQDEAEAIERWRQNNQYQQTADLLNVTRPSNDNQNNQNRGNNRDGRQSGSSGTIRFTGTGRNSSGAGGSGGGTNRNNNNNGNNNNNQNGSSGEKMFTLQRVGEIIDYFRAGNANEGQSGGNAGLININTASRDVLLAVPNMSEALADAILSQRASGAFTGAGEIASLNGMTEDIFRQVYPRLTAQATRFHVWSRGVEPDSKATVTIEAVLARAEQEVSVLYWREE